MEFLFAALAGLLGIAGGFAGGVFFARNQAKSTISGAQALTDQLRRQVEQSDAQAKTQAEQFAKQAELKAKEELYRQRETLGKEFDAKQAELREHERRLEKREDALDKAQDEVKQRNKQADAQNKKLQERKESLDRRQKDLDAAIEEQTKKLHEVSGLSREEAEKLLLGRLEKDLADTLAKRIARFENELKETAEEKSRHVVLGAVQRYAAEHTSQAVVSTVDIPSDDVKGRIIGREGRNIRTFEKAAGVDVIVDDTPGVVIVSAFDNVRRETARLALQQLIQDGRIHPARIEEVVKETQTKMDKHILEIGKKAVEEANIAPMHDKLCQLLGRLRFRTSYSQNVLNHSLEVAHLCGMIASELGLNPELARRCGLLHDIGKAADHEMEGGHPKIGADLAKRYGENHPDVLHAILGHHDDVTLGHPYTVLVASADAISAARPGARRETLEKYIRRLEQLEAVAHSFPQVEHAYAIQAGRELRVIANAGRTTDAEAKKICFDIARAIEEQLDYPGEIKVTLVRETRAVEVAK
ncbi:MAG: ribonuclease Y [Gemmataceae bacterium]|nr:ribonuclease Y [Gemmataceae bacterium]